MSKIIGRFKTINNDDIEVAIYNKTITLPNINIDSTKTVYFGDNPVIITQQNDDTFDHILKTQCKITLVTNRYLGEYLYANNWLDIIVNVWRNNECIFCGAVTPNTFDQNYAKRFEELEVNAVDILSVLKEKRLTDETPYSDLVAQSTIRPFKWYMDQMKLGDKSFVIPNLPDIDYQEAEMHVWIETGYEREVQESGEIVYYGIESNCIMLDEDTAVDTGETRRGEEKTVTWIESEDTAIVDGVPYYKEYAHITVNGEDVNTGDWRVSSNEGDIPVMENIEDILDGWTRGALPQPFEYYEHFTLSYVYDTGMTSPISDRIGDQIPEYPSMTSYNSYWDLRQGSRTDVDVDEDTGYEYYKNYGYVTVNNVAQNSGDWVRGDRTPYVTSYNAYTTGWQRNGAWDYTEVVSHYAHYSDNTDVFAYTTNGEQIPLTPSTTQLGSYYTYVQSNEVTTIVGTRYYKDYSWVSYNESELEQTIDWKIGNAVPVTNTRYAITGWKRDAAFDYKETVSYYNIYEDSYEQLDHTSAGEQIPLSPSTTANNSSYTMIQGSSSDYTTYNNLKYYKNYAWVSYAGGNAERTEDWVRGNVLRAGSIYGTMTQSTTSVPNLYVTKNGVTETITATFDNMTKHFEYADIPAGFSSIQFGQDTNDKKKYETIVFDNVDTTGLTDFSFVNFQNLKYLDVACLNTSSLRYYGKFTMCTSLQSLDLSTWDTSNLLNCSEMFNDCNSLTSLDLSNWDTSNVTTMYIMFGGCSSLTILDLSDFDTENVTDMSAMFGGCSSLTTLDLSNFNTTNVTQTMNQMFNNCNSLTSVTLNNTDSTTFDMIKSALIASISSYYLSNTVIYRDGDTYRYNSSTNKWVKQ